MAGSRDDLIDTRKRKRDGSLSSRISVRRPPTPLSDTFLPNTDLGKMLRGSSIPNEKYRAIQGLIKDQDRMIRKRGAEVEDGCLHIDELRRALDDARTKTERDRDRLHRRDNEIADLKGQLEKLKIKATNEGKGAVNELRERKKYYEGMLTDQDGPMNFGRKALAEQTAKAEKFAEESKQLRETISQRDNTISSLNRAIVQMSNAPGNENAAIAVEAQAQSTLGFVNSLKNNVAERDATVKEQQARIVEFTAANDEYRAQIDALNNTIKQNQKALEAAVKRVMETQAVIKKQNKLIKDALAENTRLIDLEQRRTGMID